MIFSLWRKRRNHSFFFKKILSSIRLNDPFLMKKSFIFLQKYFIKYQIKQSFLYGEKYFIKYQIKCSFLDEEKEEIIHFSSKIFYQVSD